MTARFRIAFGCMVLMGTFCLEAYCDPYEDLFKDVEDVEAYQSLLARLDISIREPVNLHEADLEELSRLPWVSPWLARDIVALRKSGALGSIEDLLKIEGVNRRLIELLRPFVVVTAPRRAVAPLTASLRLRLVASPAASSYRRVKTYVRSNAGYSRYYAGIVLEKDRDEKQFNDFQAAYASIRFSRANLIVGDFLMASGHGLVFSNPYGLSPSTVDPWRFSQGDFGVKPYTSVEENLALRGVAIEYEGKHTGLCVAISQTDLDARIDQDGRVVSLPTTGLHTPGTEGEDALREDLVGLAFRSRSGGLKVGLDVSVSRYSRDFALARLDWLGRQWKAAASGALSYIGRSSTAFVQGALADGGAGAVIAGLGCDRERLEFLILGRYYDERFISLHARPFSFYSGLATGEKGLLARLEFQPLGPVRVAIGNDLHKRRPEEEGLSSPSGSETFLDLELPAGDFTFSVGEKLLMSEVPPSGEGDPTEERTRLRSRFDVRYDAASWLDVRMRYENLRYTEDRGQESEKSASDLLRLDLALNITRRAAVKIGFHTFTIGSYGSRIYQYEPGVPYYPAIEMLKSDGSRWYSVLSFGMTRFGKLAAKYAVTIYDADEDRSQFMSYYSLRI
jgi:hypothetical protein